MKKKLISTFHHGFAGGSKNTCRILSYLSAGSYDVDAYFFEIPQYFTYAKSAVSAHLFAQQGIHSEVIDPGEIKHYAATNQLVEALKERKDYTLFGANLFPYCNLLHDVKAQVGTLHGVNPKLVIHPVGSDIWQIGPQIRSRVKCLLDSPLVNTILTYSTTFKDEIREYYGIKKEIHILAPVIEKERFYPIAKEEIKARRARAGLNEEDFVIHHHSSMRKVKCPEVILEVAIKASQQISRKCILIMAGPIPKNEVKQHDLTLDKLRESKYFAYETQRGNLTILWTGVESSVEFLLQISDVEINTSLHDSFNIALMEAMACGVPVVTSDVVGIKEHILASNSGFCFPTTRLNFDDLNVMLRSDRPRNGVFDIDSAIGSLKSIADRSVATDGMGERGAKYVRDTFAAEKICGKLEELIS